VVLEIFADLFSCRGDSYCCCLVRGRLCCRAAEPLPRAPAGWEVMAKGQGPIGGQTPCRHSRRPVTGRRMDI